LNYSIGSDARAGDHIWWISDVGKFMRHYPGWQYRYSLEDTFRELIEAARTQKAAS
jgi:CDP-paratose 2-epimerase